MALIFYNTLTRKKEAFNPLHKGTVGMYNCGPTVYNYAHIGNLRAYVFADILRRTLEYRKYKVTQVVNITDVGHLVSDADEGEDKMEKGARSVGKTAREIAEFYTAAFLEDLEKLNIEKAEYYPRATNHIPEQIALIRELEGKGFTYQTSDGIYFDTSKFSRYSEFAGLNMEGQKNGVRIETNPEKRNASDFALWKISGTEKRQQEWPSPWGVGFPGWHIECSAMSMKILGETFDIHTGGIDHIPVHHTNEIAQSECATGKKFVNYWLHSGFVNIQGGKMAKSAENFIRIMTLEEKDISPLAYRYWLLTAHYSKTINFSWEAAEGAQTALVRLHEIFRNCKDENTEPDKNYIARFLEAIDDDLDTPKVLALVWELVKDPDAKNKKTVLLELDKVLGLGLSLTRERLEKLGVKTEQMVFVEEIPDSVKNLLEKRTNARKNKDWKKSDDLREKMLRLGYVATDTEEGMKLSKI